jgi:hypothetical protein
VDYPPFADAVARFRSFLNDQGHRGPMRWVFPNDTLLVAGHWLVRPRPEAVVLEEVAAAYQRATTRRLGVNLGVLCREDEVLWCYIYGPADRIEAEHCLMPDGLKLSVRTPPDRGRSLADAGEWEALQGQDQVDFKRWAFM